MNSRWNDSSAPDDSDLLAQRVYTSRLLGSDDDLVLHGGGNTSVKLRERDFFGRDVDVLYVKGSGWDLATIEASGFAPVRMDALLALSELEQLSDTDMVTQQRVALLDPQAPNPSVEAILHAIIPFRFVDHTHADAIIAMTNTPGGESWVRAAFGSSVLVIPYVMPGFDLCQSVKRMTDGLDWRTIDALILMNHGVFTFGDDARSAYESMIAIVDAAERHVAARQAPRAPSETEGGNGAEADPLLLARLRRTASTLAGRAMIGMLDRDGAARALAQRSDVHDLASRGPATPDHVIHTKPRALVLPSTAPADVEAALAAYAQDYSDYVARYADARTTRLDPAPRWVVVPGVGHVAFGASPKQACVVRDIARHTASIALQAEAVGGWAPLTEEPLFRVEYWELEQAKLRRQGSPLPLAGRVALVTGAASGIGLAIAERLRATGAAVVALDIDPNVSERFGGADVLALPCDVTDRDGVEAAVRAAIERFGGLDVLVSNAGFLPQSMPVDAFDAATWQRSLAVNLTATAALFATCVPYLRLGWSPSIAVVGSKNVSAPGMGAAAYSAAKAGLTQLARVAALELAADGIRVNVVHPDAVFDTALWSASNLAQRAAHYGLTVEAYKTRNLLKTEVRSRDVANVVTRLVSDEFRCVTGAQVPVDGGNDRVV